MLTIQRPAPPATPASRTSGPDRPGSDLDRASTPPNLIFDRRIGWRTPAEGALLAAVPAGDGMRLTPLDLQDASEAGVGARCRGPIRPGTRISLYPVGATVARDCGVVARCDEHPDGGYLIGIAFDTRLAA